MNCSVARALDIVGEWWTLLIVRDLMFKDKKTFGEFLNGGEGIATNILSDRLARLERAGIVTRQRDVADARKVGYRLTDKGMDLAPVLVDLVVWSAKHEVTDAPAPVVREMRLRRDGFLKQVRQAWRKEAKDA